ncbi:FtsX-like permease family protein [Dysgonomonas sp. ZJ279]|uniref:ABC transporter permease n=1 Tax=Dysgonomonas sp. ZJ279 TaxID=2709796 RepID=UPI0013ED7615|nr:ABC transporter permease [Dysgonomonas sp. ZJ279]
MRTIIRNFLSTLKRFKMASILNILGLSVAFASFVVIMMQVDYDYNFDNFDKDADKIYRVEWVNNEGGKQSIISRGLADVLFESSPAIEAGTLKSFVKKIYFSIDIDGVPVHYWEKDIAVYPSYTKIFDFKMIEGTADALNEPDKILVPQSLAKKIFGKESALGKILKGQSQNFIIGGVYKDFPRNSSVENVIVRTMPKDENLNNWGNSNYNVFVKLNSSDIPKGLGENLNVPEEQKNFLEGHLQFTQLKDLHTIIGIQYDEIPKTSSQTIIVLFTIAIAILIIAAVNFTNFSMALAPMRIKSINTQKVLGAGESDLRRSLLLETIIISFFAFILSLVWIQLFSMFPAITKLISAEILLSSYPSLIVLTGLLSLLLGVVSGIYPAYYMTSFEPALVLKGSFGLSPKGRQLRNLLIGLQFSVSIALIISASFMYLQNYYMQNASLGFDKDQLIVTDLNTKINDNKSAFTNGLKSFAGIDNVTSGFAVLSSRDSYMGWGRKYKNEVIDFQCFPVDPSFLEVVGIDITDGRNFREDDEKTNHGVYIFNEAARKKYNLELNKFLDEAEIIGFIPDVKFASFRNTVTPMAFYVWGIHNWGMNPNYAYIRVEAGSDMYAAMEHVKASLKHIDPDYPFDVRFYDNVLNSLYEKEQNLTSLISLFSLIAIIISMVGVFGLVLFESEYRRREISIRKVLGASISEILIMFNKTYIIILGICFLIATPIVYYAIDIWLENFAYKTPMHWWVFLVSGLIIFFITVVTVSVQSWRAANTNPVDSLKNE